MNERTDARMREAAAAATASRGGGAPCAALGFKSDVSPSRRARVASSTACPTSNGVRRACGTVARHVAATTLHCPGSRGWGSRGPCPTAGMATVLGAGVQDARLRASSRSAALAAKLHAWPLGCTGVNDVRLVRSERSESSWAYVFGAHCGAPDARPCAA